MFHFHKNYFILTVLLLLVEVLIAMYAHDRFVRPYAGDFLVVVLVYCFCKTFLTTRVVPTALAVLVFAYVVEITQYFHLADVLKLQPHSVLRVVTGSSFEWSDILAYTLGFFAILVVEKKMVAHA